MTLECATAVVQGKTIKPRPNTSREQRAGISSLTIPINIELIATPRTESIPTEIKIGVREKLLPKEPNGPRVYNREELYEILNANRPESIQPVGSTGPIGSIGPTGLGYTGDPSVQVDRDRANNIFGSHNFEPWYTRQESVEPVANDPDSGQASRLASMFTRYINSNISLPIPTAYNQSMNNYLAGGYSLSGGPLGTREGINFRESSVNNTRAQVSMESVASKQKDSQINKDSIIEEQVEEDEEEDDPNFPELPDLPDLPDLVDSETATITTVRRVHAPRVSRTNSPPESRRDEEDSEDEELTVRIPYRSTRERPSRKVVKTPPRIPRMRASERLSTNTNHSSNLNNDDDEVQAKF